MHSGTEQLNEYQGPACAGSNQITENGDKLQRYSAILKFDAWNYSLPDKSLEIWDAFQGRWKSFRVEGVLRVGPVGDSILNTVLQCENQGP